MIYAYPPVHGHISGLKVLDPLEPQCRQDGGDPRLGGIFLPLLRPEALCPARGRPVRAFTLTLRDLAPRLGRGRRSPGRHADVLPRGVSGGQCGPLNLLHVPQRLLGRAARDEVDGDLAARDVTLTVRARRAGVADGAAETPGRGLMRRLMGDHLALRVPELLDNGILFGVLAARQSFPAPVRPRRILIAWVVGRWAK